jgi:multisubunit Na+/H+ antiporter MnhE subunit
MRGAASDLKTILDSAFDVAKSALQKREVFLPRIMHMQADLLDDVSDVRPCKSKVLKTTS